MGGWVVEWRKCEGFRAMAKGSVTWDWKKLRGVLLLMMNWKVSSTEKVVLRIWG